MAILFNQLIKEKYSNTFIYIMSNLDSVQHSTEFTYMVYKWF